VGVPEWIVIAFVFAFGCCIGSFLNVVIYRLPLDKSLVKPPSSCPSCGKFIRFYDNIPIFSWLILRGKCRNCKAPISPRYLVIELFTGLAFVGLFYLYFIANIRAGMIPFEQGGWVIWGLHIIMLAAFIAASAIDMELWIIPFSICWFVTAAGIIMSGFGGGYLDAEIIRGYRLLPSAGVPTASLAVGAVLGLIISLALLACGVIKRSYEFENESESDLSGEPVDDGNYNHRLEACKEIVFLLPIIICSLACYYAVKSLGPTNGVYEWWLNFSQNPVTAGVLGSIWGYFVGCGIVWAVRILGTLGFGKEAMGLGDVHLMGAAGAVIGPFCVVLAFFVAPFMGLGWALSQMFFKKTRQIPYGPFLSLGVFTVMILHDRIYAYFIEPLFV